MKPFSPWPSFTKEEADQIHDILLSNKVNYWTGSECKNFEIEFARFTNSKYAISLANGTVALDLAFNALDLGMGDEVIVTSRTFMASVSSIINAGATPIFVDVNPNTQNIDVENVRRALTKNTKAIVCVHLAGWPCDMEPIMALATNHSIFVVEDCAQAHGAKYKGKSVGSIGHIGAWSFCQDKIMTTGGEGGMVTTNDRRLWLKMWAFKDHGKSWTAVHNKSKNFGFQWLHETFGTNWRMTEIQAAIGRIQLKKMKDWQAARIGNAEKIWSIARQLKHVRVPKHACEGCTNPCSARNGCEHAAYKCYIFIDGDEKLRDDIVIDINKHGVPCYTGTCSEVYLERAFDNTNFRPNKRLPVAKRLGDTSVMFLCHPTLTADEIQKTCEVLKVVVENQQRKN